MKFVVQVSTQELQNMLYNNWNVNVFFYIFFAKLNLTACTYAKKNIYIAIPLFQLELVDISGIWGTVLRTELCSVKSFTIEV